MTDRTPIELLMDEYQLAMADTYLAMGTAGDRVAFELFVREMPRNRGYLLAAGLESAVRYLTSLSFGERALDYLARSETCSAALIAHLRGLRFEGDLHAVPEGTVIYVGEPILRVECPRLTGQLAESYLLNQVNFQTLIATQATRMVFAAEGRPVVDFGFRRAHGGEAGLLAARCAYLGGCAATATVAAGYEWGIPTSGTMSHSFVMGCQSELDAFIAFLRDHPGRSTLLIDTYDTLQGARNVVRAARATGITPVAVRIDSGDLDLLSREVRRILDEGGLTSTQIFCSGDLDEYRIDELVKARAPIDGFGVGTRLVTGGDVAALGGVYKLVESDGRPVMKTSVEKGTLPGRHQVWRTPDGDVMGLVGEELDGRPLIQPVMLDGSRVSDPPTLEASRALAREELAAVPDQCRPLVSPASVRPELSDRLRVLKEKLS
ncbi:MAG: nicotinate phosphoribosyltransferase [Gaiellales bacterium]|jgi:nicotinate phosphoribosyltransferase|nr:nicotinate phosphoribosyltransferase [Gaiellales bacterium]